MFGVSKAIAALAALGVYLIKEVAAKWGYKVALVAAVVGVYTAAWFALGTALTASIALIPANPFTPLVAQFFPSKSVTISAAALYYGTMATLKSWDYFRMVAGVAAKVGS